MKHPNDRHPALLHRSPPVSMEPSPTPPLRSWHRIAAAIDSWAVRAIEHPRRLPYY